MKPLRLLFISLAVQFGLGSAQADVPVTFQLPATGQLPATYLVTLAIVDAKNPDWIISTFVAGQPRTVTTTNGGKFTENWNGLDENFMPVPPGDYAVKGIYSSARKWEVDGEWHAITPKWLSGASSWLPSAANWKLDAPFHGDPVSSPMRDVAVGANGVGVFYYQYLENGRQAPMFDMNKPVGYDQFLRAFPSGGAGGGTSVATDGETVWAYSTDSGVPIVFRADGKSFGSSPNAHRRNSYLPIGAVTDLLAVRPTNATKTYLYIAQKGRLITEQVQGSRHTTHKVESQTEFTNLITVHDGDDGKVLTQLSLSRPQALASRNNKLYALHLAGNIWTVSEVALKDGLPAGTWQKVLNVPADIHSADMAIDTQGRFYVSDSGANKVFQLDASGKVLRSYGRLNVQKPGSYDPETLMDPAKITIWTDAQGLDRLIIVEMAGPNRVSEWNANTGTLMREFMSYQTKANSGYTVDPNDASLIYLPGQNNWLTRFKVNYTTGEWKVDAVWPNVQSGQRQGIDKPMAIRSNGNLYIASEQNFNIYRLDSAKNLWVRSAGIKRNGKEAFFWNDANNNGQEDAEELRPTTLPGWVLTYHGQKWLPDLSYISPAMGGRDIWRAVPDKFDDHGNPIFTQWQKVVTDPIFKARAEGNADSIYGGNELTDTFNSDWMQVDGSVQDNLYVQARGGRNFTANYGAQYKISRYVKQPDKSFRLKWRVGRTAIDGNAERGEILGGMRIFKPINGLLSVIDQSRSGVFLYTDDGLYVDTLFPDEAKRDVGIYRQPGEFFAGIIYPNAQNGKIYYGSGKYTPFLYEMEGWSLKENPVRPLTTVQPKVSINATQIASAPEIALTLRGGVGKARVARFFPALGGAALDGSLVGWEGVEPVQFSSSKEKNVEVRTLYTPDNLLLRWHVRVGAKFEPKPLPALERIFTHDQQADTVSFYIQGDVNAPAKGPLIGRPGDARFVFGLFTNGGQVQPVGIGMYPHYAGKDAKKQVYRTPVGEAIFDHVGPIPNIKMGHSIDADGKGFVLTASIPRSAIPALKTQFNGDLRTMINFDANLGGNDKFWWANSDGSANRETYDEPSEARLYPGSWAPATFQGLGDGIAAPKWQIIGPFGGPGTEKFSADPRRQEEKETIAKFFEAATYPLDNGQVDLSAVFQGEQIQGYWPDPKRVTWKPATIAELDTRVVLGRGSQVWYGTTWIHAPNQTDVEFAFQGHKMTTIRWSLNGQEIKAPLKDYKDDNEHHRLSTSRPVTLKAGWNQIFFRSYNVGYAPFKVGLVVKAAPEKLWPLRFSNQPPTP
jgi:hypothetical protein